MAELRPFRFEVRPVLCARGDLDGNELDNLEPVKRARGLLWVVREDARLAHPEVDQDLHADAVLAMVGLEAEALVRLDRVEALVLERVGAQLVHQPDATPFLSQVEEDPASLRGNALERRVHLLAAVAPLRSEDIAGQALGVDAYEDGLAVRNVAHRERDVVGLCVPEARAVSMDRELAIRRREPRRRDTLDELLARHAVRDELFDRDHLQAVSLRE